MDTLWETHAHTAETSPCGSVPAREGIAAYRRHGYAGVVITDHYFDGFFDNLPDDWQWDRCVDRWLMGYRAAREAGKACGLQVLLGMELRFAGSPNDYLVYGVTEALLRDHPRLDAMGPQAFSQFARQQGLFWAQAHPFRQGMTRCNPALLDGAEIYNGNPRHNSRNPEAVEWARQNGLRPLAGSDFHEWEDLLGAGIRFPTPPGEEAELSRLLREGAYSLAIPNAPAD